MYRTLIAIVTAACLTLGITNTVEAARNAKGPARIKLHRKDKPRHGKKNKGKPRKGKE